MHLHYMAQPTLQSPGNRPTLHPPNPRGPRTLSAIQLGHAPHLFSAVCLRTSAAGVPRLALAKRASALRPLCYLAGPRARFLLRAAAL